MDNKAFQDYARNIREVCRAVIQVVRCYTVYWRCTKLFQKPKFANVLAARSDFFDTVGHSLIQGYFIGTARLFDRDTRTISFRTLLQPTNEIDPQTHDRIVALMDAHDGTLKTFAAVRHKKFAHMEKGPWQIGDVQRSEMKQVSTMCVEISDMLAKLVLSQTKFAAEDDLIVNLQEFRQEACRRLKYTNWDTRYILLKLLEHQ